MLVWTAPIVSDKPWSVINGGGGVNLYFYRLGIELLESLHISSIHRRSDGGNAIFHNVPEIVVSCIKKHSRLILPVGVVHPIEGRTPSRDLDHTCGRHN